MRDAVTVGDDERRAVVRLGFLKGLDGVRVATAHSYPRDIHVTVADGLHGQILLGRLFAAGRELRHRAAGRGFGHLPAGVGIDFRVKHQEVDVAPRAEHVVQACRAYVVGPTVAPDDPDALAHQRVSDSEKRAGLRRIDARELAFQLGDALALGFDSCFLRLIGFAQTRH